MKGFHDVTHHPDAGTTPGLLLYRYGAGIVFYNASYLKKRILELAAAQGDVKWVVIDGSTVTTIDSTGADAVEALDRDLARQGIRLGLAGFRTEARNMLEPGRCAGDDRDGCGLSDVEGGDERVPGGFPANA